MTVSVRDNSAGVKPRRSRETPQESIWLRTPLPALVLLAAAFFPVLWVYLGQLWSREYYRFFPFAFVTTVVYAHLRVEPGFPVPGSNLRWTLRIAVFALGLGSLFFGELMRSPLLCFIAFVLHVGAVLDLFQDRGMKGSLAYCVFPLLLLIRPPLYLDALLLDLQLLTSKLSSHVLNAIRVDHILQGNVIEPFVGSPLGVAEACSGVQSLFTLMFVAAFIVVAQRYALLRAAILVLAAIFWSLGMNVFRVTTIAVAQVKFGTDLTSGWQHEVVGYVGMVLAILFVLSADRLLAFAFGAIPDDVLKNPSLNQFVAAWNWLFVGGEFLDEVKDKRRSEGEQQSSQAAVGVLLGALIIAFISVVPCYVRLRQTPPLDLSREQIRAALIAPHRVEVRGVA